MKRVIATAATTGLLLLTPLGSAAASAEAPSGGVLGTNGYKSLHLGQSEQAAERTGLLVDKKGGGGCAVYRLRPAEGKPNPGGGVFIESRKGVAMITGTDRIHTPEGVTMGTALDRVKAAYPRLKKIDDWIYETPAPGGKHGERYRVAFDERNTVSDFALEAADRGRCDG
ncbi:hypothetical protein [Streptomyces varsoviensis]|uniref:Lipoprotein n=1 Tax=Streptomyces varsoviensis TaxID=67373 RepID=A0ABR5ITU8_9ACTN|nr:hypothetical protein [Streptomyces varsoviensis]KOG66330.1 hypothetical protein ADK38_41490 [Streptomyces varsoviensis]